MVLQPFTLEPRRNMESEDGILTDLKDRVQVPGLGDLG